MDKTEIYGIATTKYAAWLRFRARSSFDSRSRLSERVGPKIIAICAHMYICFCLSIGCTMQSTNAAFSRERTSFFVKILCFFGQKIELLTAFLSKFSVFLDKKLS